MGQPVAWTLSSLAAVGALVAGTPERAGETRKGSLQTVLALADVNVVDVLAGQILPHRTIIIEGNRIVGVQATSAPVTRRARVVPGHGKYVIPGLWDMHVHVTDAAYLSLLVANGITGVRDMGGGLDKPSDGCESVKLSILKKWRSEVAAGQRTGPELVVAGPVISGTGWPTSLPARSVEEATTAVRALHRQQVDFIKVYEKIPLPAYRAMTSEAKRWGLTFAGHVPEDVGPLAAVLAGQRSIEHIRDPLLVCFTDDPARLDSFFTEDHWSNEDKKWGRGASALCPGLVKALQTHATWLTPTLTVEKAKVSVEDPGYVADPRRRLLPRSVRDGYAKYAKRKLAQLGFKRASERLWWRTQQQLVRRMNREGVKLLAGTDSACEGGLPGFSLHDELSELVAAGLSPLEALRTATSEPARYFGRPREGAIAAHYRANLVLLDADPLTDIANTRRIRAVILDGKLLTRGRLDTLAERQHD